MIQGLFVTTLFAQEFDFDEDDLFGEDSIEEWDSSSADQATSDLKQGVIFQNGAVKVGGSLTASVSSSTILVTDTDEDASLKDHLYDTTLTPNLSALLSVDARPTQTLRMYTKFGVQYPYHTLATTARNIPTPLGSGMPNASTTVSDRLVLKELFTDFSAGDRAFFRFGKHTVSWGAGYFFSPVSDIINSSTIDPEHPEEQVDGSLNLRTQIIFPGTQNTLWIYLIPSNDFSTKSATVYARDTGLAIKGEILLGDWEVGAGTYYKFQRAPITMITATGSISKVGLFGEVLYQYGVDSQWSEKPDSWNKKDSIIRLTAGFNYIWSDPKITLAAQYYWDSDTTDFDHTVNNLMLSFASAQAGSSFNAKSALVGVAVAYQSALTAGHNLAGTVNFGKIGTSSDWNANIFGLLHLSPTTAEFDKLLKTYNVDADLFGYAIVKGTLSYKPISTVTLSAGPSMIWTSFNDYPKVSFDIGATLGGGHF